MKDRFHGNYISNLSLREKRANSTKGKVHLLHVDIISPTVAGRWGSERSRFV